MASSKSLLSSINDIIDFTVIEKGEYAVKEAPFNLHELIINVEQTITPLARDKNLLFAPIDSKNLPLEIIGDQSKLKRILTNLLDNAVKFTSNGEIGLSVKVSSFQKNKVKLSFYIRDTGIGISNEKMSTIFESFTKHSSGDLD